MRRTPLRSGLVVLGGLALVAGPLAVPAQAAPHEIQLLGINDFHGRLEASVDDNDTDDPSDDVSTGGAELMAGAVAELSADFGGETYFVSAGDNIGASTFTSNVQADEPTIEALNAMGMVASAVGNHEFDQGFDDIEIDGRVDALADFPYLGANVYAAGTTTPVLEEYFVDDTNPAARVGFIGTVTDETASLVNPAGIAGIEFGDEAEAANRVAGQLSDGDESNGEAEVIVLLAHSGSSSDVCADVALNPTVAGADANIDAIVQGHTHTEYACPAVVSAGGFTGPVVQSGEYGESLDRITLTYDDALGDVVAATAEVLPITSTEYAATNTAVNDIVAAAVAFAAEAGSVPLGTITTDILRGAGGARDVESVLGNFIADVQLAQTVDAAGAQIAFMNPGGLRADFLIDDQFGDEACGVVTLGEANVVQPFVNAVVTKTYTGADIWATLEQQWQPAGSERPFLALGVSAGFFFEYDSTAPEGSRITAVSLDGVDIPNDDSETYRVTVNEFLASGGDNFTALGGGEDAQQLGQSDLEALTSFLDANSPVTPDEESRRLVNGETVALNVSGAACAATPPPPPPPPGDSGTPDDLDCSDFATQADAQAALTDGDPFGLDADGDGVACESGVGPGAVDESTTNPGLSVDTGVTGADRSGLAAAAFLLLAAGGAVAYRRLGAVR